jgi:RimJ/RimL family protein N-acetyltransferase
MEAVLTLSTERLLLLPLATSDQHFILELVNTEGWIRFIGDRNVTSKEDASAYIEKIIANPQVTYWVVKCKVQEIPVGIVTLIQRDYLPGPDIGFAFLPAFTKKGYAYEAAMCLLHHISVRQHVPYVFAITVPENASSIKLLRKLGFALEEEKEVETGTVNVFGASASQFTSIKSASCS